ncbi:BTB/POZ and MATH domain-containing protein 3-like [Lolium perenne]|uniref:BTB/POZ and MATH domain-containing protein 3-like n=1 Tax=Lolium perenne TaxID=4522 RepID=UPI0021EACDD9|nr:BTB/POZ and MATH domain-containing protein 3-like [Lolium perenne]
MASACTNLTGATRLVRLLRIEGFSATGSMDGGRFMASRWNVGGHEWGIRIYPAAKGASSTGSFWVVLQLVNNSPMGATACRASLACRVIDPTAELKPSREKIVTDYNFGYRDQENRYLILMSRDELASSGYLKDDTLTLQCTITVLNVLPVPTIRAEEVPTTIPDEEEATAVLLPSNLHQHLGELLQSETGADVTFLVCGESFAAHKNILAARSPVFKAEFFGGMKEECLRQVEIKDMEAATFRAMLHFIYTDTVPELDQPLELAVMMAQHLLAGADRYGLDRLKLICEIKLANGITVDTAATTLALAEQHNFSQLKAKCVEFIISTPAVLDAVLETEGYEHLAASCPSVLANLLKSARARKN